MAIHTMIELQSWYNAFVVIPNPATERECVQ